MVGRAGFLAFAIATLIAACSSDGKRGDAGLILDGSGGTGTEAGVDAGDAHLVGDADATDVAQATSDAYDGAPDLTGIDGGADESPPGPDAPVATPIWSDGSTAIDVTCRGFHEGQMRFRARRDQMSVEQLALLAQVTTTTLSPPAVCTPDVLSCTIAITGPGGGTSSYRTFNFDQICGSQDNLVANATFRPFAATLLCRYGREGTQIGGPGPAPFAPDERCFNGILGVGGLFLDPVLAVSDAGVTRHVEIDGCSPTSTTPLALDILSPDAATSVAQGMPVAVPGADQTCLSLDHAFAAVGNYRLHLSVPGVDGGNPSSWLFYRFF